MAVIELTVFSLAPGTDESTFLEADERARTEFLYQQPGIVRATTARGKRDDWAVFVQWWSDAEADTAAERASTDPAMTAFWSAVDRSTVRTARFTTVD